MRQLSISIFILILSVIVSACGFHLRGQLPLSETVNVLYVDAEEGEFKSQLLDSLQSSGAKIVDDPAASKAILQISDEYTEREALTVDTDGKASSYKLYYTIEYIVADAEQEVLKEGSVVEERQYSFEIGQAVRQESEEAELADEMRKELVIKLIRQLGAI
jgi:LPS-assembly lipoprotein